jgi:hypothetical protein
MKEHTTTLGTISPDIPNPFEGEEDLQKSCNPPHPLKQADEVTQIHRNSGDSGDIETQETQETQDILPLLFSSVKADVSLWIPTKGNCNNECMFNICRLLRTVERKIERKLQLKEIRQMFDHWAARSARYFRPELSTEDYFAEFLTIYDATKYAHDESPVAAAYALALKAPPPPGHEKLETGDFKLLAGVCYQLQLLKGGNFYLSCRTAAKFFKTVSYKTLWVRLKYLIRMGVIKEVEKGRTGKASVYEYIGTDQPRHTKTRKLKNPDQNGG